MLKIYAEYTPWASDEDMKDFFENNKEINEWDWAENFDDLDAGDKEAIQTLVVESNWSSFIYDMGNIILPYLSADNPNMIVHGSNLDWMGHSGHRKINLERELDISENRCGFLDYEQLGLDFLRKLSTNDSSSIQIKIDENDFDKVGNEVINFDVRFAQHDSSPYFECVQFKRNKAELMEYLLSELRAWRQNYILDASFEDECIFVTKTEINRTIKIVLVFPSNSESVEFNLLQEDGSEISTEAESLNLWASNGDIENVVSDLFESIRDHFNYCENYDDDDVDDVDDNR